MTITAMVERLTLGLVINVLDQRRATTASFASQVVAPGLILMLMIPGPAAFYAG